MADFEITGNWFGGEWVDDQRQVIVNIVMVTERSCWLRIKETMAGKTDTLNKIAQIHPGSNFYGRGEQLTAEDFMLIQVGENDFNLIAKRFTSQPIILDRKSGQSIDNSHWTSTDGHIQVWTYPLDKYPLVIQLKALTPWAADTNNLKFKYDVFGAMSLDGRRTFKPDSSFSIYMQTPRTTHILKMTTRTLGDFTMEPFV